MTWRVVLVSFLARSLTTGLTRWSSPLTWHIQILLVSIHLCPWEDYSLTAIWATKLAINHRSRHSIQAGSRGAVGLSTHEESKDVGSLPLSFHPFCFSVLFVHVCVIYPLFSVVDAGALRDAVVFPLADTVNFVSVFSPQPHSRRFPDTSSPPFPPALTFSHGSNLYLPSLFMALYSFQASRLLPPSGALLP